jgi:formate hydrogenlyase transcriptional activator
MRVSPGRGRPGAKHADVVGWSAPLARVLEQVATTSSTVLVNGETGKGKELVARAIYQRSNLRKRLFVTVNCAALPAIPFGDEPELIRF